MAFSLEVRRAIRTGIQTAVAFALALPAIVDASGVSDTLPWVAGGLAVAGGFARVMALPSVQSLLALVGLNTDDDTPAKHAAE